MTHDLPEYDGLPPQDGEDEVRGHVASSSLLRCWDCRRSFEISGHPREDVFYSCTFCHSLNQPDLSKAPRTRSQAPPSRPPGSYQPPQRLDSIFLRDARGGLFEMSRQQADACRVGPERLASLGHPPFVLDLDEVAGRHKSPTGTAADASAWNYHQDWQHGCYLDEITGQFLVGLHRHPYGDERAVGALESDFS